MGIKLKSFEEEAKNVPDDPKKFAIVGLSAAGKTCLLKTLFRQFDAIENLNPTRRVERSMTEFLHHKLSIWDYGGQKRYTENYLAKPELFFKKIAQLFYVVDCQNKNTILESISYFKKVVDALKKYSIEAQITILYNKFDPAFEDQALLLENMTIFKEKAINFLNTQGFGYQGYQTSKDVPVWVMTAFSKSMLDNPEIVDSISKQLQDFSEFHELDAAVIFTSHGFGLGYHFSEELKTIEIRDLFIKFFTKFEQMYNLMPIIDLQFQGIKIFSTRFFLDSKNKLFPVFLGFIYKNIAPNSELVEEIMDSIRLRIKEIFSS
jgi:GTPase SAR1 family protein